MLPNLTFYEYFWLITAIICGPMLIIGYILSIIKAIRDRRLIMKRREERALQIKRKSVLRKSFRGSSKTNDSDSV